MALKLYDKLTPSGDFALIDAADVELENGMRLDAFLQALAESAGELDIDYEAHVAFDTSEIVVGVTEDTGSTTAVLGKAILGKMILGHK